MKMTVKKIRDKKNKEKIVAITAYDYSFARLIDSASVDIILVGDSLGMVYCGEKDTKSVTIDQMVYHTKVVARGVSDALLIGDMPINTYHTQEAALLNAKRLIEVGAEAIKIEETPGAVDAIEILVRENIPVMGHVGLTPQTASQYKVQGRDVDTAEKIMADAKAMEQAGCFAIVLECIPQGLAEKITKALSIPTIGIGAGKVCDGQILVCYDLFGLFPDFRPKFARSFFDGANCVKEALEKYRNEIESGTFPAENESFF